MSSGDQIKLKLLKRKLHRFRPKRKPVIRKTGNFRSILLIGEKDKTHLIQTVSSFFPNAKIEVLFLREEKEDQSKKGQYTINVADFGMVGKLKNEKLDRLTHQSFDLAIDFNKESLVLRYFSQLLTCSFIAGIKNAPNEMLYDLIIDEADNEKELIKTIATHVALLTENGKK